MHRVTRGQVYWLEPPLQGEHVMRKVRPYLVVSCELNNLHAPIVNVVAISSKPLDKLPMHHPITIRGNSSIVECEHVYTFSLESFTKEKYYGKIGDRALTHVDFKLGKQLGVLPQGLTFQQYTKIIGGKDYE